MCKSCKQIRWYVCGLSQPGGLLVTVAAVTTAVISAEQSLQESLFGCRRRLSSPVQVRRNRPVLVENVELCETLCLDHLVLPGNGNAARGHFTVERLVLGLQLHPFNCGELLDVQHVFTVDGLRIRDEGCLQHAGLQPFEVDGAEDGMSFDLSGSAPQAAQPLGGIFGQQLRG